MSTKTSPQHAHEPMLPSLRPLTLIVATTSTLGIGRAGTLPWPSLKQEMAYFASVTKRSPDPSINTINAVIMGRKTWDSIPGKFRPLKDRLNVVISRSARSAVGGTGERKEGPLHAGSLEEAVKMLEDMNSSSNPTQHETSVQDSTIGELYVIGGASIYAAALQLPQTRRVLVTKIVKPDYECDTFFPLDLGGPEGRNDGWMRKTAEDLRTFVGAAALGVKESDEGVRKQQGDVEWEYCMYERAEQT